MAKQNDNKPSFIENYNLTKKQMLFCEEYLANGFNQGKAAEAAGYLSKKTNKINASSMGAKILNEAEVKRYINDRLSIMTDKFDEIMASLINIALGQDLDQIALLEQGSQYLAEKKIDARDRVKAASEIIKYKQFQEKLNREDIDREDRKKNDNIIIENLMRQLSKEEKDVENDKTYEIAEDEEEGD